MRLFYLNSAVRQYVASRVQFKDPDNAYNIINAKVNYCLKNPLLMDDSRFAYNNTASYMALIIYSYITKCEEVMLNPLGIYNTANDITVSSFEDALFVKGYDGYIDEMNMRGYSTPYVLAIDPYDFYDRDNDGHIDPTDLNTTLVIVSGIKDRHETDFIVTTINIDKLLKYFGKTPEDIRKMDDGMFFHPVLLCPDNMIACSAYPKDIVSVKTVISNPDKNISTSMLNAIKSVYYDDINIIETMSPDDEHTIILTIVNPRRDLF